MPVMPRWHNSLFFNDFIVSRPTCRRISDRAGTDRLGKFAPGYRYNFTYLMAPGAEQLEAWI